MQYFWRQPITNNQSASAQKILIPTSKKYSEEMKNQPIYIFISSQYLVTLYRVASPHTSNSHIHIYSEISLKLVTLFTRNPFYIEQWSVVSNLPFSYTINKTLLSVIPSIIEHSLNRNRLCNGTPSKQESPL